MKIAFVTDGNCIRVLKEAVCLKNLGHEVHLVSCNINNTSFNGANGSFYYDSVSLYSNHKQFENAIKHLNNQVDIFHYHNLPTWQAYEIRRILPKCKLVLDVHDSFKWYSEKEINNHTGEERLFLDEEMGFACADGIVTPSPGCTKGLDVKIPIIDLPPAVPEQWYRNEMLYGKGGLVSQGGHALPHKLQLLEKWRDYTDIYTELLQHRDVYVYSPMFSDKETRDYYHNLGAVTNLLGYNELLKEIGLYSWNLVGNTHKAKVFDVAMPNKFYDAIAAGIPSVVFNVKEVSGIVKKYDMGITVETVDELIERWDEHLEKRKNLLMSRYELTMEKFIGRLTDLYGEVLCKE